MRISQYPVEQKMAIEKNTCFNVQTKTTIKLVCVAFCQPHSDQIDGPVT